MGTPSPQSPVSPLRWVQGTRARRDRQAVDWGVPLLRASDGRDDSVRRDRNDVFISEKYSRIIMKTLEDIFNPMKEMFGYLPMMKRIL